MTLLVILPAPASGELPPWFPAWMRATVAANCVCKRARVATVSSLSLSLEDLSSGIEPRHTSRWQLHEPRSHPRLSSSPWDRVASSLYRSIRSLASASAAVSRASVSFDGPA